MKRNILTQLWSHRLLLPLLLLTGLSISALITVLRGTVVLSDVTYGLSLTGKHYAAFGAILLNFLIYFRRSEERRVGKECVRTCRYRGSLLNYTKNVHTTSNNKT